MGEEKWRSRGRAVVVETEFKERDVFVCSCCYDTGILGKARLEFPSLKVPDHDTLRQTYMHEKASLYHLHGFSWPFHRACQLCVTSAGSHCLGSQGRGGCEAKQVCGWTESCAPNRSRGARSGNTCRTDLPGPAGGCRPVDRFPYGVRVGLMIGESEAIWGELRGGGAFECRYVVALDEHARFYGDSRSNAE